MDVLLQLGGNVGYREEMKWESGDDHEDVKHLGWLLWIGPKILGIGQ